MPDIGKRIKKRREELKMTQEELAVKLNYKSKTTIAKIENGTNDIVQSKVVEFAKALDTTPAYLMGWTEGKKVLTSTRMTFYNVSVDNEDEAKLILNYRDLSTTNKKKVFDYADGLVKIQKADEELDAAHTRTDIDIPEGTDTSENDIMDDENF
ncbi:MAG: helix-turn-helix domain-containing protein [Lachnospiraceae bacterium]